MATAEDTTDLPPGWANANPYKKNYFRFDSVGKWRVIALVAVTLAVVLVAALVTVTVLWTQQPKVPVWLEQRSVIRAVITENSTMPQSSSNAQRSAASDSDSSSSFDNFNETYADSFGNNTANDSFVPSKFETTSIVLSLTDDQVQILVLPGLMEAQNSSNFTSKTGSNTQDDEVLPMVLITANPKNGDISSVQASQSAANATHFVNTAMLVAQQLLIDTTAIESHESESNAKRNSFASEEDCSLLTSFGTAEYCKTTQLVDDEAVQHQVYLKQFSNSRLDNSRRKRNADTPGTDEDGGVHKVDVQIEAHISRDTGLLESGVVSASAELNVLTDASGTRTMKIERKLSSQFEVMPSSIDHEVFVELQTLVSQTDLVNVNDVIQSKTTSPSDTTTDNTTMLRNARASHYNNEVTQVLGMPIRIEAYTRDGFCSVESIFRVYVGKLSEITDYRTYSCTSNLMDLIGFGVKNQATSKRTDLFVYGTPVGSLWVYLETNTQSSTYVDVKTTEHSISGNVKPSGSLRMNAAAGWHSSSGETRADVSFNAPYNFNANFHIDLATCRSTSSASLGYSKSGRQVVYYITYTHHRKCWKIFRRRILCGSWQIRKSAPHYIYNNNF